MGDEQQRPVERAERRLELLDRRQVEVVGRLVEHEPVRRPTAISSARLARVRSPGESARRSGATASLAEPELGQQRARLLQRSAPLRADEGVEQRAVGRRTRRGAWSSSPTRTPGPTQRVPAASGTRPSSASTSVVLPLPFGPTSAIALAPGDLEVERAEREAAAPHDRAARAARRSSPERSPPPKRSCSSQRRHGLSTVVQPLDRLLGRARPSPPASPTARSRLARPILSGSRRLAWRGARRSPTTGAGGAARSVSRSRSVGVGLVALLARGARPSRAARGSPPSRRRTPPRCGRSRRARARA